MEVDTLKQKKYPLLGRERVTGFIHFTSETPSRLAVRKAIAQKTKNKEEKIVVRHIYQRFGENKAKVIAHVYDDEKMMKQLEPEVLLKKHRAKEKNEEPEAEEKTAQTPKEIAPAEESKQNESGPSEPKEAEAPAEEKSE
jgi:ribosomal protein S24E